MQSADRKHVSPINTGVSSNRAVSKSAPCQPVALAHSNDPASECSVEELERTRAVRRKLRTRGERDVE
jgi:hypothetical protein